jgi:tetratricopeptide (TPR) repeat protein
MIDPSHTIELYEQAIRDLNEGRYAQALWGARELKRRRYSGCFEVAGRVFVELRKLNKAIRVLHAGVSVAPSVGMLWHWLGTAYSDNGEYDLARTAFCKALESNSTLPAIELYNLAVVEERAGDITAAIEWLSQVESDEDSLPAIYVAELQARLFIACGRFTDAHEILENAIEESGAVEDEQLLARMEFHYAEVSEGQGDRAEALDRISSLLERDFWTVQNLRAYHRLSDHEQQQLCRWKLLVRCEDDGLPGYESMVGFAVNAIDIPSAVKMLEETLKLFRSEIRMLALEESEPIADVVDYPGVHQRTTAWHQFPKGT